MLTFFFFFKCFKKFKEECFVGFLFEFFYFIGWLETVLEAWVLSAVGMSGSAHTSSSLASPTDFPDVVWREIVDMKQCTGEVPSTRAKGFSSGRVAKLPPGVPQVSRRVLNLLLQSSLQSLQSQITQNYSLDLCSKQTKKEWAPPSPFVELNNSSQIIVIH